MGVIVKEKIRGSGQWWVYTYHHGKKATKKLGDKRSANKFAGIMREQILRGDLPHPRPEVPTLDEYYQRFERSYLATAVKESTRDIYEMNFRVHILPELGHLRLDEINRERMEEFVAHLVNKDLSGKFRMKKDEETGRLRKLSKHSIRLVIAALGVLYRQAIEHGIVEHNPTRNLGKFYRKAPVRHEEIQPLSGDEVQLFLTTVVNDRLGQPHYALFLAALHTGMRSGELAGLQLGDIDFNSNFATIRRNYVNGRVTSTKTEKIRKVDLSDALVAALKALLHERKEEWLRKGQNTIPSWVFCNSEGNPLNMKNLKQRIFKKVLQKAGLRQIRFHDLRHSYATLLIQQGESLAYVKDQLGHSTIAMTVDTYTHWIPGSNRQAVNRLPSPNLSFAEGEVAHDADRQETRH